MTRKYRNQPETAFGENERWHPDGRVRAAMGDDAPPMQTQKFVLDSGLSDNGAAAHGHPGTSIRLAFVGLAFLLLFAGIGVRLYHLAATLGGTDAGMRSSTQPIIAHRPGTRAQIFDRNGELLAANLDVTSLFVDPKDVLDIERTVNGLMQVFPDKDPNWIRAQVTSDSRFRWIQRSLTPNQELAVRRLGLPGVRFSQESRRFYPKGDLVSHILGYTGLDNEGLAGFERSFDKLLNNSDEPIYLSLDIRAQHIVAEELQYAMDDFSAPAGAAVLMDTSTSEIISMVSLPTFDPYELDTADEDMLFNRASLGVYELGSIFKVFTVAMAMNQGGVRPTDEYNVARPLFVGRWEISDFKEYEPYMSVAEILARSSNKGSAQLALDVGGPEQQRFLRRIGLLSEPRYELPEVGRPGFPRQWGKAHTATISYGQGISVSPLQVTNAFSAMVNGGTYREPTLLRTDGGYRPGSQVIRPDVSEQVNDLLRFVVTEGTGRNADAQGYQVGGKTGTADIASGGGYAENRRNSSFLGGFPMDNPRYSLLVLVYDPVPNERSYGYATGGWVAAPAFKRMVERLGPILGVAPEGISPEIIIGD